jgi:hypothetical protein
VRETIQAVEADRIGNFADVAGAGEYQISCAIHARCSEQGPPFAIVAGDAQSCVAPSTLSPGQSCTVTVEFSPESARGGSFEASFEIRSDSPSSPDIITLRASAQAIPIPIFGPVGLIGLILGMLLIATFSLRARAGVLPDR